MAATATLAVGFGKAQAELDAVLADWQESGDGDLHGRLLAWVETICGRVDPTAKVRLAGVGRPCYDTRAHEQTALALARTEKRITSSDLGRAAHLGTERCRQILAHMVAQGQLERHGSYKGTSYTLPEGTEQNAPQGATVPARGVI